MNSALNIPAKKCFRIIMINCNLCNFLHVILFEGGDAQSNLSEVLVFSTGARNPPPLGFANEPVIEFTGGEFPKANVCSDPVPATWP